MEMKVIDDDDQEVYIPVSGQRASAIMSFIAPSTRVNSLEQGRDGRTRVHQVSGAVMDATSFHQNGYQHHASGPSGLSHQVSEISVLSLAYHCHLDLYPVSLVYLVYLAIWLRDQNDHRQLRDLSWIP